jgi:diguanylate cyclase (GGDEF)-like protein/putative nucleotidyltransferase with HDIG domain
MKKYPKKILIIEQSKDHVLSVENVLNQWAEDHCLCFDSADSTASALKKFEHTSYDLVLTDSHLQGQTGLDFLNELKHKKISVPVILMVHPEDKDSQAFALRQGFADYIVKSDEHVPAMTHIIENVFERFLLKREEEKLRVELAAKNIELDTMNRRLSELSVRDEVTGLYNHRFLQEKLAHELSRAMRYHHAIACLMIDPDHFKVVNSTYGHMTGDKALKELGDLMMSHVRESDTVARYGGEEFVVLLPHASYEGAHILAERLRKTVMEHKFISGAHHFHLTISIGVSVYPEDSVDDKDNLLLFADRALYRAKGSGRNKVCFYRQMAQEFEDHFPELKIQNDKIYDFRQRLLDISELAKQAYIEATKALINALEVKDPYTLGHAERVSYYSTLIAVEMQFDDEDVKIVEHAALLHDIGKICIPDEILLKPGPLTPEEYEQMKTHATLGYQIVRPVKFLAEEALIILHHHEWFDGDGYPHHLKRREIPIGARIVSIADAYDTIRQAGARYKKTMDTPGAARELIDHSGSQFDPKILKLFLQILVKKGELQAKAYDHKKLEETIKLMVP